MGDVEQPWAELSSSGLLWLINRVVFHPGGFALGASTDGWMLEGDGTEPWAFGIAFDEDALFAAAEATLAAAVANNRQAWKDGHEACDGQAVIALDSNGGTVTWPCGRSCWARGLSARPWPEHLRALHDQEPADG